MMLGKIWTDLKDYADKSIVHALNLIDIELNKKINKSSSTNKIYGTDSDGNQKLYDKSEFSSGGGDASNKVDKTDDPDKIYGTDENGSQTLYTVEEEDEYETPEDPVIRLSQLTQLLEQAKEEAKEEALRIDNPVGTIRHSEDPTNPYDILGFGTWHRITDKYLWAINDNESVGDLGGSETSLVNIDWQHNHSQNAHGHTENSHNHTFTGNATSSAGAHAHSTSTTTSGAVFLVRTDGTGYGGLNPSTGTSYNYGSNANTNSTGAHTHTISGSNTSATSTINNSTATNNATGSQTNSIQTIDTKQPKYGVYVWRRVL